jgi:hypothetical protein
LRTRRRSVICHCIVLSLLAANAAAQPVVCDLSIAVEPAGAAIRPLETAVVRVHAYGPDRVPLPPGGAEFRILEPDGGWLSRPFARAGADVRGSAPVRVPVNLANFDPGEMPALRDSVLYTAPERPGVYRIEAVLEGKTAMAELRVERDAPVRRQPEKIHFTRERRGPDRYLELAAHYAPYIAQETWFDPKADYLARFDFDGNWRGDDNWDNTPTGSSQAYVYYAAMETSTHWFLIYNFFHPRDYAERCLLGTCHENDNEGMLITVRKDGSEFGYLQVMQTLAHGRIYSYAADPAVQDGLHKIAGSIAFRESSHPVVSVEAGGHGVFSSDDSRSRYSRAVDAFPGGTGVTYVYAGEPRSPRHANDRNVGYELLPLYDEWWMRAVDGRGRSEGTFDDDCPYQPLGGRPAIRYATMPCSFLGRAQARNRAKPFWGWLDLSTRPVLAKGQWGLDPAYSVSRLLSFPARVPFSLDYVFNPFLKQ